MSEKELAVTDPIPDEDDRLDKFKKDIALDYNVTDIQRDQANEDMRFVNVTGGMWEGFLTSDFGIDRVKLELDLTSDYLQRFLGEWNDSRTGVEFKADDSKTTDDDAEMLNGIYRSDYRDLSGRIATNNAVLEAATCGYGAMKLATVFEDDEDPENDNQRIEWRPIHNAYNNVVWDQAAERIDKRDARWVTVLKPFTKDSFAQVYPDKDAVSAFAPTTREFQNITLARPDFVYVATRYEVQKRNEKVHIYNNLRTGEVEVFTEEDHELVKDELGKDEFRKFVRKRAIVRRRVEKSVFSGEDFLSAPRRIAGKWLPVVPFYGYRSYVDGVEWSRGLIRTLKDAQRLFNMQVSQLAENAASHGQSVPIFLREQMLNKDVQANWADRNNKPYQIIDPATDDDGNILSQGPVAYLEPDRLGESTKTLMGVVPDFMQSTTGGAPQDTLDPNASGKAIQAVIKRENLKTALVRDNIDDAITHSGEVYQGMAAEVYTTQRILKTISKDGTDGEVQLFESVQDSETGRIIEANTLKGKKFKAYADSGPAYDTLREQTVEDLKGMLDALGGTPAGAQYTPALIAVLLDNITGVGLDPIKEMNRRIMLVQGLVKPETPEEEAMVQQARQTQQDDPQSEFLRAEAGRAEAEARSLDASSTQKVADARKKGAEVVEIFADIETEQQKLNLAAEKQLAEERQAVREQVTALPVR